jgi:hypothetical protein
MSTNVQQSREIITGCVEFAGLFQDPLLEEPPTASASREARRRYLELAQTAETLCTSCPLVTECLYRAVVEHDVSGFAAGPPRSSASRSADDWESPSHRKISTPWRG